jgi:hypothetical protein
MYTATNQPAVARAMSVFEIGHAVFTHLADASDYGSLVSATLVCHA